MNRAREGTVRFVLQCHESRHPHFDFRLERNGVFVSWAMPKGLPTVSGEKRLAVRVDDHSLTFGDFEGDIPAGERGAGKIWIVESGEYQSIVWTETRIVVRLFHMGEVREYAIVPFRHGRKDEWLVVRRT